MSKLIGSSILAGCLMVFGLTSAAAQSADLADRYPVCENRGGQATAGERVTACSEILAGPPLAAASEAMARVNRAWAYSLESKMADARADYDIAVRLNPASYVIYNERGLFNLRVGQSDAALSDYDAALKLAPGAAYSLYGRGLTLLRKGERARGQADLAAARQIDAQVDQTFRRIGLAP